MTSPLKLERIHPAAKIPTRAHPEDSGLDIFNLESGHLFPGETKKFRTGWKMSVPAGFEIQIRGRSGLALEGIVVSQGIGTVDSNFRGEVCVILRNCSEKGKSIPANMKIAQMVIQKVELWTPEVVQTLDITDRGEGGFGSTGV